MPHCLRKSDNIVNRCCRQRGIAGVDKVDQGFHGTKTQLETNDHLITFLIFTHVSTDVDANMNAAIFSQPNAYPGRKRLNNIY